MKKNLKNKAKAHSFSANNAKPVKFKWHIFLICVAVMAFVFVTNFPKTGSKFFHNFQLDSQGLITAKIDADKLGVDTHGANYGWLNKTADGYQFVPAKSHKALQGYVASALYNKAGLSVKAIQIFYAFLLALTLSFLCWLLRKEYDALFAWVFYLVFLLSPWVTAMARNLYWAEFLMFLPAVLILLALPYLRQNNIKIAAVYTALFFIAVLIKCLCGYEFLSSIMLFALTFPATAAVVAKNAKLRVMLVKYTALCAFLFVFAFACALTAHAKERGGTVSKGLQLIWKEDITRRTYSSSAVWTGLTGKSLQSSAPLVVAKYLIKIPNGVITGVFAVFFLPLILLSLVLLVLKSVKTKVWLSQDNAFFMFFFLTSISWFVAAKGHSYIHTHINYVLWYFGFVQMCFYVPSKFIKELTSKYARVLK